MGDRVKGFKNNRGNLFGTSINSKRRSYLGIDVAKFFFDNDDQDQSWNYRRPPARRPKGDGLLERGRSFELLSRAKSYLAARSVEDVDSLLGLDWRRTWNKSNPKRPVKTLLDLFPSLKFSYETLLPMTARLRKRRAKSAEVCGMSSDANDYIDVVVSERRGNDNKSVRFDDICRSHSIWLDPVDSPKELYKWRLRVQRAISWAYDNDCVPFMMTLTIYHRWHPLKELLTVLRRSWDKFFVAGRSAVRRRTAMGLVGYVRRLEITINDGQLNPLGDGLVFETTNCGWHPHYHVIGFVPYYLFGVVSDMEECLRREWAKIVAAEFRAEFGEEIPPSYLPAFAAHGLHFSRYRDGKNRDCLRPVEDSVYLDKIQGYDHMSVYGVDNEIASEAIKDSKVPFDLLRDVSAANIDLWCEYAVATKGLSALQFSNSLIAAIGSYFDDHPERDPIPSDLPQSEVIARIDYETYRLFYLSFLIPQLRAKAAEGYESLRGWVCDKVEEIANTCDLCSLKSVLASCDVIMPPDPPS